MADILETVLLLALPASGKSEVRRYLDSLTPASCRDDFHMGATVQLDDFPYVHLMRRIDDELAALGKPRLFFEAPDKSFRDSHDWGTLTQFINVDFDDLVAARRHQPESPAAWLFERLDQVSQAAGAGRRMATLDRQTTAALSERLAGEADQLLADKHAAYPDTLTGKTLVIEFARGGPEGSEMPIPGCHGYRHSLSQLSPEILEKAVILYIWVTPEESRRKNANRADPDDPGSILHHGVPEVVMRGDYGCDDIDWLLAQSDRPGTIKVEAHGKSYYLPIGRFDNRVDKTTFLHGDRDSWPEAEVTTLHHELKSALDQIYQIASKA